MIMVTFKNSHKEQNKILLIKMWQVKSIYHKCKLLIIFAVLYICFISNHFHIHIIANVIYIFIRYLKNIMFNGLKFFSKNNVSSHKEEGCVPGRVSWTGLKTWKSFASHETLGIFRWPV